MTTTLPITTQTQLDGSKATLVLQGGLCLVFWLETKQRQVGEGGRSQPGFVAQSYHSETVLDMAPKAQKALLRRLGVHISRLNQAIQALTDWNDYARTARRLPETVAKDLVADGESNMRIVSEMSGVSISYAAQLLREKDPVETEGRLLHAEITRLRSAGRSSTSVASSTRSSRSWPSLCLDSKV